MPAKREVHTGNMDVGQLPPLVIPGLGEPLVREAEDIVVAEGPSTGDYQASLAFNEEVLTIRIEPSREKNAKKMVDVYVQGRPEWIPVGKPWKVKRKYVEVLARAKPVGIETKHESINDGVDPVNRVIRTTTSLYPFTVIHDPNPRGYDWLTAILASA